jgi:hypothetical protein
MTTYMQTQSHFFGATLTGHGDQLHPYYYLDRHPMSAAIKGAAIGLVANKALDVLSYFTLSKPVIDAVFSTFEAVPFVSGVCKFLGTETTVKTAICLLGVAYKLKTRETPYVWQYTDPSFMTNLRKVLGR